MIRVLLTGAVLALLVSGCGSERESREHAPNQDGALLRVTHVVEGPPLYVEGAIWHVRVVGSDGAAVLDRKLADDSVSVSVDPGRYELQSEEFPCDGNCNNLGPATDSCSTEVTVDWGQELAATVNLRPSKGCSIAVPKSART
jgi:hypothetical protein